MDVLEIIDEYNRNIRTKTSKETWDIYLKRVSEYKKEHPFACNDLVFMYPDVIGWNENWLENARKQEKPSEIVNKLKRL